jgi:hypothetical protein
MYGISLLINGGVDPETVQRQAGHASLATTPSYYHGATSDSLLVSEKLDLTGRIPGDGIAILGARAAANRPQFDPQSNPETRLGVSSGPVSPIMGLSPEI